MSKNMKRFRGPRPIIIICFFSLFVLFIKAGTAWGLTETAQKIYQRHSSSVYQIQIIDVDSGEKSVIGSGFSISKKGFFATNFHVISQVVNTPDRYRIEYHKGDKKKGELTLVAIDVAHDLALLQGETRNPSALTLGSSKMPKGNHVFPMGNPMDLGMNIIEGTYNGKVGVESYQHILLSAPLNPGMSGGPAFDTSGKVIGINVAMGGNDLSFLVPVEYLISLFKKGIKKQKAKNWRAIIQDQLLARYDHLIHKITEAKLSLEKFGSLKVPTNLLPAGIKCWGNSAKEDLKENQFYNFGRKWCRSEDRIFVSSNIITGSLGYSFMWMESESLNSLVFYKDYSYEFSQSRFYPYGSQKEMREFKCSNDFVKLADHDWKAAYCVRQYKKYPELHDVVLNLAVLGDSKRGIVIRIGLGGIS